MSNEKEIIGVIEGRKPLLAFPIETNVDASNITNETISYESYPHTYEQNTSSDRLQIKTGKVLSQKAVRVIKDNNKYDSYFGTGIYINKYYVAEDKENNITLYLNPCNAANELMTAITETSITELHYRKRYSNDKLLEEGYYSFSTDLRNNDGLRHTIYQSNEKFNGVVKHLTVGNGVYSLKVDGCTSLEKFDLQNAFYLKKLEVIACINLKSLIVPDGVENCTVNTCLQLIDIQLPTSVRAVNFGTYIPYIPDKRNYITKHIEIDLTNPRKPICTKDENIVLGDVIVHLGNPETQYEVVKKAKTIIGSSSSNLLIEWEDKSENYWWNSILCNSYAVSLDFDNVEFISDNSFYHDVIEEDNPTRICYKYTYLENANFGNNNNYVELGTQVFASNDENDVGLKNVILPKYKKKFGTHVFAYSKIEHLDIPETWSTIDKLSFSSMRCLTSVTIPKTIKLIERGAFSDTKLTFVTIAKDCVCETNAFPSGCTINYYDD